jgi:hypothetical protein
MADILFLAVDRNVDMVAFVVVKAHAVGLNLGRRLEHIVLQGGADHLPGGQGGFIATLGTLEILPETLMSKLL